MGWRLKCYESGAYASEPGQYDDASKNDGWLWDGDSENREAWEFQPSTDIAAAWEVLVRMQSLGHPWVIEQGDRMDFATVHILPKAAEAQYMDGIQYIDDMEKTSRQTHGKGGVPLAICLTALKALGVPIPDEA